MITPILVTLLFVSYFLIIIHFGKKHHCFESLSHSLLAQNICKDFLKNMIIQGGKSHTNIRILYIVIPFGNASVYLCSGCAN
jgi:hypothetical protein